MGQSRQGEREERTAGTVPVVPETTGDEAVATFFAGPAAESLSPGCVIALQRSAGNASVNRLMRQRVVARDPTAVAEPEPAAKPGDTAISEFSSVQDAKSAVIAELENLTRHQLIALNTLKDTAELKDPPREPSLTEKIIMGLLLIAVDKSLGSVGGHIAEGITEFAAKRGDLAADLLKKGSDSAKAINDQITKVLENGAKGLYAELFPPGKAPSTTPILAFFDQQSKLYSAMGADRVTQFTNKAAQYDAMEKDQALLALELLRKASRRTAQLEGSASGPTYRETLSALANLIAELRGGRTTSKEHAAGELDAARLGASTAGVLSLKVRLDEGKPVIEGASMGELNEHLRSSFADRKIGDLGINVHVRLTNQGHTWVALNTGGTVFLGPRETGQAYHYVTFNVMRSFDVPSEKRRLYANQSLTGAGGWGYIDENGTKIPYEKPGFRDDDEDVARKKDVQAVWDEFRGSMWAGAHKFMEGPIMNLTTPSKIDAA